MIMRMKTLLLLLLSVSAATLSAQIAVKIEPGRPLFMLYDSVYVKMIMRNYSSHPIAFGNSKDLQGDITFRIITPGRTLARRIGSNNPLLRGVILAPGETRGFTFNLSKYYFLQEEGMYTARVTVKHPQLPSAYESNEIPFKIRKGTVIWQRKFGLPDYTGEKKKSGKIENRTYKLLKFTDSKSIFYYMMIDDDKKVYAVRRIGFDMGSNLQPQREIDALARFHIMIAVTPKIFAHYIYNYNGVLERRDLYIRTTTTPYLVLDPKTSEVRVDGGRIARKDLDFEEINDLPLLDEVKTETDIFEAKPARED